VGGFKHELAINVKPGDLLAVTTRKDLQASFTAAAVVDVQRVTAVGEYTPGIEMPYFWADGAVAPL
jgi:hypothetical protein